LNSELRPNLIDAAAHVIDQGNVILGEALERFESEFAAYCGVSHAVGVGNGLDAMTLILRGLDIGRGSEVIVPGHTFVATWLAVSQTGATIVPVDIDPETYNLDPAAVSEAITPQTRAIIAVHLYGQPADMQALARMTAGRDIALIEDAAQAHGAGQDNRRAGNLGTAAAFSFYPTKNLGAMGDGGAVTTNDAGLAERIRRLRNYGSRVKYVHEEMGVNSRLDEIQAAMLLTKLPGLDGKNARRREIAQRYNAGLANLPGLVLPTVAANSEPVWHLYVVRSPWRAKLQQELAGASIGTLIHYPTPPHRQTAYANTHGAVRMPETDLAAAQVLSLPMWPEMTDDEVEQVIDRVRKANLAAAETPPAFGSTVTSPPKAKFRSDRLINYDVEGYDAFRGRAQDETLSRNQRAGFPDEYRASRSASILRDIGDKLPAFRARGTRLLDIGCGCGELAETIIRTAGQHNQSLTLIDSAEMLDQLPTGSHVRKVIGPFPACLPELRSFAGQFDAILVYSVAQYVFSEANLFGFVDAAIGLLNESGALLLGDLPNASMRKRFIASPSGARYHETHYPGQPQPVVSFNKPQPGQLDDAVVLALVARSRTAGLQAFVLPQSSDLPMANRREDILIRRP
jgi:dTDP-4-amino-4,6-dideoxygalactose transaminase/2-polyprenyl-3-methyl-5-hydroxy-6-metoxy-1,4-benzoquinol methylase